MANHGTLVLSSRNSIENKQEYFVWTLNVSKLKAFMHEMEISHIQKKALWKNQLGVAIGVAMATNLHATFNRHGSLSSFYSLCSHQ